MFGIEINIQKTPLEFYEFNKRDSAAGGMDVNYQTHTTLLTTFYACVVSNRVVSITTVTA